MQNNIPSMWKYTKHSTTKNAEKLQNLLKIWWQEQTEKYCCDPRIFDYKKFVNDKKQEPEVPT